MTITDSLMLSTGSLPAVDSRMNARVSLRNDTIIAAGSGAIGLNAEAGYNVVKPGAINARNVIVHATTDDLRSVVSPNPQNCIPAPCKPGDVTIDHSLFASSIGPVAIGDGNVSGDAMFADAALGDFHLRPGSPAIDAGVAIR